MPALRHKARAKKMTAKKKPSTVPTKNSRRVVRNREPRKPSPEPPRKRVVPPTPPKKEAKKMTTAAKDEKVSYNANTDENKNREKQVEGTGKPIDEMTHEEHKAYLIAEAEKNEKVNDEIYKITVDSLPKTEDGSAAHGHNQ
jgi:hypothetical protein